MPKPFEDPNDPTNWYWFVAHKEDVGRAECSPDDAAKLLEYAAEYLENGEVAPKPLAEFLALAFRRTAAVADDKRPAALAEWLHLTAPNRRPSVPQDEFGLWVFRRLWDNPGKTETGALNDAAKHHGIGKTTATVHWRNWKLKNRDFVTCLEKHRPTETLA